MALDRRELKVALQERLVSILRAMPREERRALVMRVRGETVDIFAPYEPKPPSRPRPDLGAALAVSVTIPGRRRTQGASGAGQHAGPAALPETPSGTSASRRERPPNSGSSTAPSRTGPYTSSCLTVPHLLRVSASRRGCRVYVADGCGGPAVPGIDSAPDAGAKTRRSVAG